MLVYSPEIVAAQFSFQVEEGESSQSEGNAVRATAETIRGDNRRKKCCSRSAVCWKQPSLFPVTNNMIRFPRDGGFVSKNLLN